MTNFINPVKDGYMTSDFGYRTHPVTGKTQSFHQGVDIARQPNTNVDVLASADGTVIRVGALGTYGNIVFIKHSINGKHMETNYAHLKDKSTLVKVGDKVKQGQKIATMGTTGSSTAPHLHFEIHNGAWVVGQKNAINPELHIKLYTKGEMTKMKEELEKLAKLVASQGKEIKELKADNEAMKEKAKDTKVAQWAKAEMAWGIKNKITDGTRPNDVLTRQEAIVMINRHDTNCITNKK